MSPSNINSFVGDLVQMAQAMEQLPKVEQELEQVKFNSQNLELRIIRINADLEQSRNYAASLEQKVRSLEVERDDASFRVLEVEERLEKSLAFARMVMGNAESMVAHVDPPKPLPEPQAQPVATQAEGQSEMSPTSTEPLQGSGEIVGQDSKPIPEAVHSISETDQSESLPTSAFTEKVEHGGASANETVIQSDTASFVDPGPALGPYFGKRYHDHPTYLPLHIWLDGGGTEEDYHWRPIGYGSTTF